MSFCHPALILSIIQVTTATLFVAQSVRQQLATKMTLFLHEAANCLKGIAALYEWLTPMESNRIDYTCCTAANNNNDNHKIL